MFFINFISCKKSGLFFVKLTFFLPQDVSISELVDRTVDYFAMVMEKLIKAKAVKDAAKRKKTAGPGSTSTPGGAANDDSSISFSEWNKSADSSNTSLNTSVTKFVGITSPNPVGSGGAGASAAATGRAGSMQATPTATSMTTRPRARRPDCWSDATGNGSPMSPP